MKWIAQSFNFWIAQLVKKIKCNKLGFRHRYDNDDNHYDYDYLDEVNISIYLYIYLYIDSSIFPRDVDERGVDNWVASGLDGCARVWWQEDPGAIHGMSVTG